MDMAVTSHTSNSATSELWACKLGTLTYEDGLALQSEVHARRRAGEIPDTLLLLEHPPTYTRGRRSGQDELGLGEDFFRARGIDVFATDRGGKVTYHGPGQLVGYPIMEVRDVGGHLRKMEAALIETLTEEGIVARSRRGEGIDYTGVWVDVRKIASIGVHVSRGISTHGFAVNLTNDLQPFEWIVPCGLPDVQMTSVLRELDREPRGGSAAFSERVASRLAEAHEHQLRFVDPREIGTAALGTPLRRLVA
jgi:lipoyl(octanoyl) transferase